MYFLAKTKFFKVNTLILSVGLPEVLADCFILKIFSESASKF